MTKNMKFVAYSSVAIGAVLTVGLFSYVLGWLRLRPYPADRVIALEQSTLPLTQDLTRDLQPPTSTLAKSVEAKSVSAEPASPRPQLSADLKSLRKNRVLPNATKLQGRLRVTNRTMFPIRLAVLSQRVSTNPAKQSSNVQVARGNFREPTHWDFDPEEGSGRGLILSLPEGDLKLSQGDILTAFAQDGSRRYWGPYVVGETAVPAWNRESTEWQLVLKP